MSLYMLFQENVTIVDSPGVGESEAMNEFVVNYMSNAFCFMYVINTHNAGGVQKDRVRIINSLCINCSETANPSLIWKHYAPCSVVFFFVVNSSTNSINYSFKVASRIEF